MTTRSEPSGKKIEKKFATGFINGLATPGAKIYAERCQHGVASVKTEVSFLNMLVGGLTFGIYSPMSVTVKCAGQGSSSASAAPQKFERFAPETEKALREAVRKAAQTRQAVTLTISRAR